MKVLLRKDVKGVGQRGSVHEVADGYALNFLIARGLAEQATAAKLAVHTRQLASDAVTAETRDRNNAAILKKLDGANVVLAAKANEQGHLYRQLSSDLISEGLKEQYGVDLPGAAIHLEQPIKITGDFEAQAVLGEKQARIRISVVPADN